MSELNLVTPEYPKGHRKASMTLVELIRPPICWTDILRITDAIDVIERHAKSMKAEQESIADSATNSCEDRRAPGA